MDDGSLCCAVAGWAILWTVAGYAVGAAKGNEGAGTLWGLMLGPLGLIITALLPDSRPPPVSQWPPPERAPPASAPSVRARVEAEERALRSRIEQEERLRMEIRAKLEAEARAKGRTEDQ